MDLFAANIAFVCEFREENLYANSDTGKYHTYYRLHKKVGHMGPKMISKISVVRENLSFDYPCWVKLLSINIFELFIFMRTYKDGPRMYIDVCLQFYFRLFTHIT